MEGGGGGGCEISYPTYKKTRTYQGVALPFENLVEIIQFKDILWSVACKLLLVMCLPEAPLNIVQGVRSPGGYCQG